MRTSGKKEVISEINVTPFVDVLLVILIIFMVTAPMMNMGYDVNLPKSSPSLISSVGDKKAILSIDSKNNIYLDSKKINLTRLSNEMKNYKDTSQIYIKADKSVRYQEVISLMSRLNSLGFSNISLVTEVE